MNSPTKNIKTPIAGAEVEIKDWITGEEAEHIEAALTENVDVKPDQKTGANFGKFDVSKALFEHTKREIKSFVASVNGEKGDVVKAVMSLPEEDYRFVTAEISKRRKKKLPPEATPQTS